jgi:hypothetical protein
MSFLNKNSNKSKINIKYKWKDFVHREINLKNKINFLKG